MYMDNIDGIPMKTRFYCVSGDEALWVEAWTEEMAAFIFINELDLHTARFSEYIDVADEAGLLENEYTCFETKETFELCGIEMLHSSFDDFGNCLN